jgi:hypothetical protein
MLKVKREKTIKNPENRVPTTVYFSQEQFSGLKAESARIGSPVAEIVRRAVVVYLQANGPETYAVLQQSLRYKIEKS